MAKFEFLVLTSPIEGTDTEFNRWYDHEHLQSMYDIPGFIGAQRFQILDSFSTTGETPPFRYAAIYTMECEDPAPVLQEMRDRMGTPLMTISESLDKTKVARFLLQPMPVAHAP